MPRSHLSGAQTGRLVQTSEQICADVEPTGPSTPVSGCLRQYFYRRRVHPALTKAGNISVSHTLQPRDSILHRRVSTEEILKSSSAQRIHDKHMRGRRICIERYSLRPRLELPQCTSQPQRVSTNACSRRIGLIFTGTRNSHLNQSGGDWG